MYTPTLFLISDLNPRKLYQGFSRADVDQGNGPENGFRPKPEIDNRLQLVPEEEMQNDL